MYIENERENLLALSTAHNATNFFYVRGLIRSLDRKLNRASSSDTGFSALSTCILFEVSPPLALRWFGGSVIAAER